jgi:NADPH:quinone reductase-like Zn-dependent oxidoreductase
MQACLHKLQLLFLISSFTFINSGLSFQDLMTRLGAIDSPPKTPTTLGFECAGEIEAVGEDVTDFKVGDRVIGLPEFKAWAELCTVPTKYVYKLPDDVSFQDAAAMVMNYLVAYIIVFDLLSLRPGKTIMLHSAGGSVGLAIAQLIRTFEGITLYGICSKSKHDSLKERELYDQLIDRTDYVNEIRKISPEGVDIVLDCLCGEDCNRGYGLLKPMGKYILYGSSNVVTGETKSFFSVARSVSRKNIFSFNMLLISFFFLFFIHLFSGGK